MSHAPKTTSVYPRFEGKGKHHRYVGDEVVKSSRFRGPGRGKRDYLDGKNPSRSANGGRVE